MSTRYKLQRIKGFSKQECPLVIAANYIRSEAFPLDLSRWNKDAIACILFVQGVNLTDFIRWKDTVMSQYITNKPKYWSEFILNLLIYYNYNKNHLLP